ncbi:hypothetical protein D3C80_2129290 [compost metagenome]
MQSPSQSAMRKLNSQGSAMPRPLITTAAMAPMRLPSTRPRLLLMTPPTVGKLTTAAEVMAQ